MQQTEIRIENARSHNLKGVSCTIPLGSLTVVTGVSGSGKSTLAFDTLYAEGQRRYVASLSTYARQFLERLPRPEVDRISSLPPAIAIEQRNRVNNARSTVGTATELLDHLRLLFAQVGRTRCPDCDRLVERGDVPGISRRIAEAFPGLPICLAAPLRPSAGESGVSFRDRLAAEGFSRVLDAQGELVDWVEADPESLGPLIDGGLLLVDRLAPAPPDAEETARMNSAVRLSEGVASAFARGAGEVCVLPRGAPCRDAARFRQGFACDGCGRRFPDADPARLSFNSPLGACAECQGFGRKAEIDWQRVVPDPLRSLEEQAIAPFATAMGKSMQRDLMEACEEAGVRTDVPFDRLAEAEKQWVLGGDEEDWYGVQGFFDWLEGRRYKVQARVLIARYRRYVSCEECRGTRLCDDARAVEIGGLHLGDVARFDVRELKSWLDALSLEPSEIDRCKRLLETLATRVATVEAVGLGYMGLDRQMRTLSGGEAQRIQLATALGGGLTASLYVLDEPSIGLHASDMERLLAVLCAIRDQGNTVVVVEHALRILEAADYLIDLGPGAGRLGGQVMAEGSLEEVRRNADSPTGRLLRGELDGVAEIQGRSRSTEAGSLRIVGARERNLRDLTVEIPLGRLVAVTGVSGAGKSSLVDAVLVGNLLPLRPGHDAPGDCDRIEGREDLAGVVVVDQTPAVRSPRSNPATVSKAFDRIRQKFAATREARALGVGPGWFSFNVPGGRCDVCEGSGEIVIDMQFLDDVHAPCDACGGLRYRREVLGVRLDGRSIVEVLGLTIEEALTVFAGESRIESCLEPFRRVGLGYLTLGQPLSTLSGGEHQRVRLALALARPGRGILYVLDEPTTGLHAADVRVLLACLDELIAAGGSVLVVEHDLDVIQRADWVIDLGPGGGPDGGMIVAQGPPSVVAGNPDSATGRALVGAEKSRVGA
jgi:excinuclease ABC subunit A